MQSFEVVILDMATILAQVHGNTVSAGILRHQGGDDWIGIVGAPGLPQGGDVVNVDPEFQLVGHVSGKHHLGRSQARSSSA